MSELRLTPVEARARVARAQALGPRRTLTGQPLQPLLPRVAAACASGELSGAHASVIIDFADHLPPSVTPQDLPILEDTLIAAARHEHPVALGRTAALLLRRLDADGPEPGDRIERERGLTLSRYADGSSKLTGRLTIEATATWATILDALSAPRPAQDGERDDRTATQRRHDALIEAGQRLLRSASLPPAGGVPVTILVRTTLAELHHGTGIALTDHGEPWPLPDLLACATDAEVMPIIIDECGAVLMLGRTVRLASRPLRLALAARDGGCCFPGCDRPPAWTQAHHLIDWADGGPTDINNLCLLCHAHHRQFKHRGWRVTMRDGLPEWTPPPWIDPTQTPRRNHAHHPPDIDFSVARDPAGSGRRSAA